MGSPSHHQNRISKERFMGGVEVMPTKAGMTEKEAQTKFRLHKLMGKIAQEVLDIIFKEFGYKAYPYGMENYHGNLLREVRKERNQMIVKLRTSPDLAVLDPDAAIDKFFLV